MFSPSTVSVFSAEDKSTFHVLMEEVSSKTGFILATQPSHFRVVLKFIVSILFYTLMNDSIYCYFFHFNRRLLVTTLTELKAIAAPAHMGSNKKPFIG